MRRGPSPTAVAIFSLVGLAMVGLIVLGLGRGGVGVAHYAAGAIIALAGALLAVTMGKR
ncbi:hypothetical protein [Roseomonas xinghualingensis]|uniref:hypothetical protein n=1 Tax=Roseomonas xinghualingensis TaxID=2986475 RepID=UPI0021F1E2EA|nr:hypothetical protein [Roseomonas sp. SXEYE001]MCV4208115.1 hypothetical protein [Roseomonas sp. SXEYE001]